MKRIFKIVVPATTMIFGVLVGIALEKRQNNKKTVYGGSLVFEQSEANEQPSLYSVFNMTPEEMVKNRTVILKIIKKENSQ